MDRTPHHDHPRKPRDPFGALLARAAEPPLDFAGIVPFWEAHRSETARYPTPFDRAALGGASVEGLGPAFVAGYQAALRALVPSLDAERLASLCATEAAGAHPSSLTTRLERRTEGAWALTGQKQWTTGAGERTLLLVVATTARDDAGRNRLRVALVEGDAPGVRLESMPPTPFVPEIPHARVHLDDVRVEDDAVLVGDGYDAVLKPFRTVEDLHVTGAALGLLLRVGVASGWTDEALEALLAALAACRSLAFAPPAAPAVHLAVAGVLAQQRRLLEWLEPQWDRVAEPTRTRWRRDVGLLAIAGFARERRRTAAWKRVRSEYWRPA
jgi:acyl-CoA dehydrogenase